MAPSPPAAAAAARLEPLNPHHLQPCLALDQRCLGGLWTPSQWRIELGDARRPGLGAWHQGALLAMACGWLIVDELHITLVAVDPSQRGQGLGGRVLEALLNEGRCCGAERATLEVASTNAAALRLYARAGFREAGRRRGYYRNGDDALIQWLRLCS